MQQTTGGTAWEADVADGIASARRRP